MSPFLRVFAIVLLTASCGGGAVAADLLTVPEDHAAPATPASRIVSTATVPDLPATVADDPSTTTPTTSLVPWGSARLDGRRVVELSAPTRLLIDRLDIDAPITALGVDPDGVMDVPKNVTEVAWYRFGSVPGEPGSAVLAAHVDMAKFGPGVFFEIDKLVAGDEVTIEFEDGSSKSFVVSESEEVFKSELDVDTLFAAEGVATVRLVTCGGGFNPDLGQYDSNFIVTLLPSGA